MKGNIGVPGSILKEFTAIKARIMEHREPGRRSVESLKAINPGHDSANFNATSASPPSAISTCLFLLLFSNRYAIIPLCTHRCVLVYEYAHQSSRMKASLVIDLAVADLTRRRRTAISKLIRSSYELDRIRLHAAGPIMVPTATVRPSSASLHRRVSSRATTPRAGRASNSCAISPRTGNFQTRPPSRGFNPSGMVGLAMEILL